MPKRTHKEEQQASSKTAMAALAGGGVLVAALVVWALTRTVQPVPESTPTPTDVPITASSSPSGTTPVGTLPPLDPATGQPMAPPNAAVPAASTDPTTSGYVPNPPTQDENATVQRMAVNELRSKIDTKAAVTIIDVRDKTSYVTSHIPGALHIPMATVESQVTFLPKDKPIVTYCT